MGEENIKLTGKNNVRLQLYRNKRYVFIIDSAGHPFWIKKLFHQQMI